MTKKHIKVILKEGRIIMIVNAPVHLTKDKLI